MNLGGFTKGARAVFSFPRLRTTLLVDAFLAGVWFLLGGVEWHYILYTILALPIAFRVLAREVVNLKRAYGLTPLFLSWGILASRIDEVAPLSLLPPTLMLLTAVRFLTGSSARAYSLLLLPIPLMVLWRAKVCWTAAALMSLSVTIANEFLVRRITSLLRQVTPSGFKLLKAFIHYTLRGDKEVLERELVTISVVRKVPIYVIDLLEGERVWAMIVVPHIHPGPYKNVGSSDLPSRIIAEGVRRGIRVMVLHGASQHSEDLASSHMLGKLIEDLLLGGGEELCSGDRVGVWVSRGAHTRVLTICFEDCGVLSIVERVDGGMEDVPFTFTEVLSSLSGRGVLLVDAHNCLDPLGTNPSPTLNSELGLDILKTVSGSISPACASLERGWLIGLSTSPGRLDLEVGEGGISTLTLIKPPKTRILLVSIDCNNIVKELKEKIEAYLNTHDFSSVMVTSTDTHAMTGAKPGETYRPLGTSLPLTPILERVSASLRHALNDLKPLKFRLRRIDFEASFLDPQKLEELSIIVDYGIKRALLLLAFILTLFPISIIF